MGPTWREIWATFGKIGLLSFGGPAAQIALMHREVVARKGWLSEQDFLNGLGFCTLLPGPEAMQLATYAGWKIRGTAAGLLAGLLFVIPGACVVLALSILYVEWGEVTLVQSAFLGIKAAVMIVVVQALLKVSTKALHGRVSVALAVGAFVALFFIGLPFPIVIVAAGAIGALAHLGGAQSRQVARPSIATGAALRTIGMWLAVWWAPLLAVIAYDPSGVLAQMALFFSKLAVVSFGGAYAVLAYMGQVAVETHGWLSAAQMIDGLGLAETTPGPLILVTQFVGFLGGISQGGYGVAIAAVAVTLWATFAPCFLWIFAGAPFIDYLSSNPRLRGALAGITAAVVGVIANLSAWFALHLLFGQVTPRAVGPITLWSLNWATFDPRVLLLMGLASALLFLAKRGLGLTLLICAIAAIGIQTALVP